MNGEEEEVMEFIQEPHPPSLIEDQPPPGATRDSLQVEECEALEAPNEPEVEREAPPLGAENVDGGEGGCGVGDSSLPGEGDGQVIGSAEVPLVKNELGLENERKGEVEAFAVTAADDRLIGGVEDSVVAEQDSGGRDEEILQADNEGGESMRAREAMEEEHGAGEEPVEVKKASPEAETGNEVNGHVDVGIEEPDVEAPKGQGSWRAAEEEEKLDRSGEFQREMEQDGEPEVGEETAQVDEKMDGNKELEEAYGSNINDDGLLPCDLQDGDMIKKGKAEALDSKIKGVEGTAVELEEVKREMKEEEEDKMELEENRKIKEDEEMEGEEEIEVERETEEGEERELEKEIEEEEEREVERETEEGEERELERETEEKEEREVGRESEEEEELEREMDQDMDKEIEDEEGQRDAREDEEMEVEGEVDKEMEEEDEREVEANEEDREESPKRGSGKQKRGRNSKYVGRVPSRKTVGEDVCFICLDEGDLVLCDRRGCPKAYHPSCADLDESFFQSKSRWNCGWHFCRQCKKNACFMCYTCQFSLCKGCAKGDASFICVRGNKGLCGTCMKSVMLIENNDTDQATVDDKSSPDHLFEDYWTEQKEKLSLTSDEIAQAKSRWKQELPADEILGGNPNGGIVSDRFLGTAETADSKRNKPKKRIRSSTKEVEYDVGGSSAKAEAIGARKKGKRRLKSQSKDTDSDSDNSSKDRVGNLPRGRKAKKVSKAAFEVDSVGHDDLINEDISLQSSNEWASKELLEFVMHMKGGDKSPLSQFDVQELLLEYIQRNKLRDPRRKSQIVCDAMLQKLFGKQRVGHFEMLKLLELHFLVKEDSQADDNQGSVVDAEGSQLDADENADSLVDVGKYRGRKARKKGDGRGLQSNLDDYAAIDMHNITLIYLRRNLIEALLEDSEGFHDKVVGSFVRIRIPGSNQKQDIYRLVQVIGTNKVEPYKVGKRIAYCMLEILNLNKTEVVSIDTISNQDFTEDECKRLRQSIKCGLISRLTVGDVLDKAKDLQAVRVIDWLETEITRLNHLRDRASDLGRKKELRECVEKVQLLSTPEERQRRLDEIPDVHADPNMDPSHESEDESEPEEKAQESSVRPREAPFQWREREHFPSRKGDSSSTDPWTPTSRLPTRKRELTRSLSGKGFSSWMEDTSVAEEALYGSPWSPVRDKVSSHSTGLDTYRTTPDSLAGKLGQSSEMRTNASTLSRSETSQSLSASVQNPVKVSDSEKLWHYKDPTGKVQGPFSVVQLRKWNKNGYFPASMRIWRTGQSEDDDSILLTAALAGRFEKDPSLTVRKSFESPSQQTFRGQAVNMLNVDQVHGPRITRDTMDQISPVMHRSRSDTSSKGWSSHQSLDASKLVRNDSPNLSSTPQSRSSGWTGRSKVSRWSGSPTPIQLPNSASGTSLSPGANGMLPSPTPESSHLSGSSNSPFHERNRVSNRSNLTHQPTRDTVSFPRSREDERYAQKLPLPQSPTPATHQTLQQQQPITDTMVASTIHPGNDQNPAVSAHGWVTSGAYMPNPETTNNANNAMHLQGQQQQLQQTPYGQWPTAPANNPPPPPPPTYGNSGTFPAQNPSAAMPSQAPWVPQVPATQPNMQWVGMAAPDNQAVPAAQYPGNSNAGWAPMQQPNPNMGWGAPAGQFGLQPGPIAPPANVIPTPGPTPGMQPANSNVTWPPGAGNMNPGWAPPPANPAMPAPWNWQQPRPPPPHGSSGMFPQGWSRRKSQMPCPYLMQGHCKKGANCDYRHN